MRERGKRAVAAADPKINATIAVPGAPSMIIQCGDPGAPPDCDDPPPPPPPPPAVGGGGATLASTMTKAYCYTVTAATDVDNDQIRDDCEAALASRLAPLLNIGNDEWASARQPYWAASRNPDRPDNVQIIYALAYVRDGGFFYLGSAHEGDSEFIILEVINTSGSNWGIIGATLSAHFNAEDNAWWFIFGYHEGGDSYYWDDLDYPQGPFPRIWSSLGKHANYRNRAACEAGAWIQDSCQGDYIGTQIPAPASRNLGNFYNRPLGSRNPVTQLIDCTLWEGPNPIYSVSRTGTECFWRSIDNSSFAGWDPSKPQDATPYRRIFEIFGF